MHSIKEFGKTLTFLEHTVSPLACKYPQEAQSCKREMRFSLDFTQLTGYQMRLVSTWVPCTPSAAADNLPVIYYVRRNGTNTR